MEDKARARELPDHALYIVTKRLIKISTDKWGDPSHDLLEDVYRILVGRVNDVIDNHFPRSRYERLHQDVRSIVNEVLADCQASALQKIDKLLDMEKKAPFTLHEPYLADYRGKYLMSYREARAPMLRGGNHHLKLEELIARDSSDPALRYMASARAYFRVAFKRFTDMVPMMIDEELLRGLDWDRGLKSTLTKRLEITGPGSFEKAKEYLEEPLDVSNRRESLLRRRDRLQSAKRALQSI